MTDGSDDGRSDADTGRATGAAHRAGYPPREQLPPGIFRDQGAPPPPIDTGTPGPPVGLPPPTGQPVLLPPPAGFVPGGPPPVGYLVAPRQTNGMAIAALVCSLVLAPLGIIFGHISLSQIKRTGEGGRGMAIGGLVIGYVSTVGALIVLLGLAIFAAGVVSDAERSIDSFDSSIVSDTETATARYSSVGRPPVQVVITSDHYETHDAMNELGKHFSYGNDPYPGTDICVRFSFDENGVVRSATAGGCEMGGYRALSSQHAYGRDFSSLCPGPSYFTDGMNLICLES